MPRPHAIRHRQFDCLQDMLKAGPAAQVGERKEDRKERVMVELCLLAWGQGPGWGREQGRLRRWANKWKERWRERACGHRLRAPVGPEGRAVCAWGVGRKEGRKERVMIEIRLAGPAAQVGALLWPAARNSRASAVRAARFPCRREDAGLGWAGARGCLPSLPQQPAHAPCRNLPCGSYTTDPALPSSLGSLPRCITKSSICRCPSSKTC